MKVAVPVVLAVVLGAGVALAPFAYKARSTVKYRNFRVVTPGVLYRSGQMTPDGFARVFKEFGIQTVISLRDTRDDGREPNDGEEIALCRAYGIDHVRFEKADWSPDKATGEVTAQRNVERFLRLLADPGTRYPILIHCFAGIHRTGSYCAIYRMEYDGWKAGPAIEEMRGMGNARTTFADNLLDYLEDYTPRRVGARVAPVAGGAAVQ
jgi:protein tyrosine/serine phosphatase